MRRTWSHGRSRPRREGGFILLDAVVALGIAAILAGGLFGLLRSATVRAGHLEVELNGESDAREASAAEEADLFRRR
mgnify:FL=1